MISKNKIIKKGMGVNTLKKTNQKGFTLIELLVVIAIIGLLASVVLLSLNSARQKSRDAKRLADIRQVASALELYYNDCGGYPVTATVSLANSMGLASNPANGACPGGGVHNVANVSNTIYLAQFPSAPTPADTATCQNGTANDYRYAGAGGSTFTLQFCIGAATGGYSAGLRTLSEGGIK